MLQNTQLILLWQIFDHEFHFSSSIYLTLSSYQIVKQIFHHVQTRQHQKQVDDQIPF